jgi:hypothetical protein
MQEFFICPTIGAKNQRGRIAKFFYAIFLLQSKEVENCHTQRNQKQTTKKTWDLDTRSPVASCVLRMKFRNLRLQSLIAFSIFLATCNLRLQSTAWCTAVHVAVRGHDTAHNIKPKEAHLVI